MENDDLFNTNKITVHTEMRTGRKVITVIYGLGKEYDTDKILKHFQKTFHCTGNVGQDKTVGEFIKLTGNHKQQVIEFFITEEIATRDNIVAKGI